jgi:NTP pyrophosphatase (non-canonical NTP hydrolase)
MSQNPDNKTTIAELRELVEKFVSERDWNSYHTPKALAIAISIESAELLEHFLFSKNEQLPEDPKKLESFENEMADIFIYILSLANSMDIKNFSEIVYRKMEKNRLKYPIDKFSGDKYQKQ